MGPIASENEPLHAVIFDRSRRRPSHPTGWLPAAPDRASWLTPNIVRFRQASDRLHPDMVAPRDGLRRPRQNGAMAEEPRAGSARPVGSVARAIAVIDALAANPDGLGVNEVARQIEVNPSTASRLLATLELGGIVQRTRSGPYQLGLRLVALADTVLDALDIPELARPVLRSLVNETGETASLSVPGSGEAVTIDFLAADASVVGVARLGRRSVGHATATGKIVLAFGTDGVADTVGALTPFTDRTITDPAVLDKELGTVRARGFAEAVAEREVDLAALAVPIFGRGGTLAAIVGLQGPTARLTTARRREVLPALRAAGETLTRAIGGSPPSNPRFRT
jgi:DNA-binding IclR family transcriptional regulator